MKSTPELQVCVEKCAAMFYQVFKKRSAVVRTHFKIILRMGGSAMYIQNVISSEGNIGET